MEVWLLFFIMGVLTYALIRRTVPRENKAPIGLLWLVMMLPASSWLIWILIYGTAVQMPLLAMLPLLIISPVTYWSIIEWGKPTQKKDDQTTDTDSEVLPKKSKSVISLKKDDLKADQKKKKESRPISNKEEEALRDCFPWGIYYLQNIDYYPWQVKGCPKRGLQYDSR